MKPSSGPGRIVQIQVCRVQDLVFPDPISRSPGWVRLLQHADNNLGVQFIIRHLVLSPQLFRERYCILREIEIVRGDPVPQGVVQDDLRLGGRNQHQYVEILARAGGRDTAGSPDRQRPRPIS